MVDYSRFKHLKVETKDRIATVTLNRPERLNAIHGEFHEELEHLWADIAEDSEVYAIVLTGAGRAFCSGGDVKAMSTGTWAGPRSNLATPSHARRIVQNMLDVEQPLIAAVNGDAMGLGATLALFCDITVMADTARIADTHV